MVAKLIKWSIKAQKNINEIWKYISKRDGNQRADDVVNGILSSVKRLEQFPNSGRLIKELNIREVVLTKYPYIVPYVVRNDIVILSVYHSKIGESINTLYNN